MSIFDLFRKKPAEEAPAEAKQPSKDEILKRIYEQMAQQSPSRHFAAGSVFDIVRKQHDAFEQIVRSNDVRSLLRFFATSYISFCNDPASAGFFNPDIIKAGRNDTDPRLWNANIIPLESGDAAALCFMPVRDELLAARIIGVVLGQRGDGYYYCMLNKDGNIPSDVMRNKAVQGVENAGTVKGLGFELMNAFLDCIRNNYYTG